MFRRLLSLFLIVGLTQIAQPLAEAQPYRTNLQPP